MVGAHKKRRQLGPHLTRFCVNLAASLSSVWGGVVMALEMY